MVIAHCSKSHAEKVESLQNPDFRMNSSNVFSILDLLLFVSHYSACKYK
jgi:hypothetical protein